MNYILYFLLPLILNTAHLLDNNTTGPNQHANLNQTALPLFKKNTSNYRASRHSANLNDYTLLLVDTNTVKYIRQTELKKLSFQLPFQEGKLDIELESIQLFTQDFKVITDKSNGKAIPFTPGLFYSGKIIGDPKSTVTLSIIDQEVRGIISSTSFGNLNLGLEEPEANTDYILFNENDVTSNIGFDCRTAEEDLSKEAIDQLKKDVEGQLESRAAGCVSIDFELTHEVYTNFQNSTTAAADWMTTLFAGVKTLYLNESIDVSIKTIFVWTTDDGYSADVSSALTTFVNRRFGDQDFSANLVHLVRGRTCGSSCSLAGVAYLNALCRSDIKFGVSEPLFTYSAYPAYSWSINVITHELGHNMGSNHTHWCGWSGGPIDNCATKEGSCSQVGPTPAAGGGTIMSYCHQSGKPGISFANGFGPQPGNVIRSRFNSATCLSTNCSGGGIQPTCSDGIQNGDETGIDCGGSCSNNCNALCPAPTNISQGKTASQSTTYHANFAASRAIDGNNSNFNHTNAELQPWWQVDLGGPYLVTSIEIRNRTDCCGDRIKRMRVFVSNSPIGSYSSSGSVYEFNNATGLTTGQVINLTNLSNVGRYVRIWVDNTGYGNNSLHLAEVRVMGCVNTVDPCLNNQNPTVSIQSPATYVIGSQITINADADDPAGSISQVNFYNGSTLLGADNSSPYSWTINPASGSTYSISAVATDNCSATGSSNTLSLTGTSTCSDGVLNGTETGVDCGGSCAPCPVGCTSTINISQGKSASQSSTYNATYPASRANDGSNTNFNHTNAELQPWWQVDLGDQHLITSIEIRNRPDCCGDRIKRMRVFVSNSPIASYSTGGFVYEFNNSTGLTTGQVININSLFSIGRYVRIWVDNTGYGNNSLHLAEVRVMGCVYTVDPCLNNQNPTVTLQPVSTYIIGSDFTINADANDPGGSIAQVNFYNGVTLLGSDNSSPYSWTVNAATNLSYSIQAVAVDNCSATATSNTLTLAGTMSCTDGVRNGTETGIDCGGSCDPCPVGCLTTTNISQGKSASQSTTYSTAYPASRANDGSNANFNHTNAELQPWWQVDLGDQHLITSIEIRNRPDCCGERIKRMRVFVSNSPVSSYSSGGYVYEFNNAAGLSTGQVINITSLLSIGRYVRIWVDNTGYPNNSLHVAEVRVMGCVNTVDPCLANQNPTVSVSTANSEYIIGSSIVINANANDIGGIVSRVEFYDGSTLLGSDQSSPFSWTINPATSNTYDISALAVDNCNSTAGSNTLALIGTSSCTDGIRNGNETGIDCGGTCDPCPVGCVTNINLSQGKTASQSTTYNSTFSASKVNDGNNSNFNHTNAELQPWWSVDLGANYLVTSIEIRNRVDCCGDRIKRMRVFVSSSPVTNYSTAGFVYEFNNPSGLTNGQIVNINNLVSTGRYVKIWVDNTGYANNPLHLAEVRVLGCNVPAGNGTVLNDKVVHKTTSLSHMEIKLFPNPVHEFIQFKFSGELSEPVLASVFDLYGRRLLQNLVVDNQLNISGLVDGSYIVHLDYKGEKVIRKIIKF